MLEALQKETDLYRDHFARRQRAGGGSEPAWLTHTRKSALAEFERLNFPTTREEDWKYTSLAPIARGDFAPAGETTPELRAGALAARRFGALGMGRIVFVNGRFSEALSNLEALPPSVKVRPLAQAIAECPDLVERHLGRGAGHTDQALTALNAAFLSDGVFLEADSGTDLEESIQILHVAAEGIEGCALFPRNLILVGDNCRLSVIESYLSLGASRYWTNAVTEVELGNNSQLRHERVQDESREAFHTSRLSVSQGRDSTYANHNMALGALLNRNDIHAVLDGEGAHCTLDGLFIGRDSQHIDNHTTMEHARPHGDSRELYKGILDGKAKGVFHGRIIVRPHAQKTDSKQTNDNLLLSDNALVNTKPQLEIYADDVKCTHGATIGQLQADALFYLRARGIGKDEARSLLIYAFASEVVQRVQDAALREALHEHLAEWLPGGRLVREAR